MYYVVTSVARGVPDVVEVLDEVEKNERVAAAWASIETDEPFAAIVSGPYPAWVARARMKTLPMKEYTPDLPI